MKPKRYTQTQRIAKLEKVVTQLFLTLSQMQKEIKKLNPEYKTLEDDVLEKPQEDVGEEVNEG